jgi:hypothetical protein
MTNLTAKYEDLLKESEVFGWTSFFSQSHCGLDLTPSDLKIKRDHLLKMTNLNDEYEKCGLKES